jgi:hypothetical protein
MRTDTGVWVGRARSVIAWDRCHLVCHWRQGHLSSNGSVVGSGEAGVRHDHGGMTDDPCVATSIGEQALPLPQGHRRTGVGIRGAACPDQPLRYLLSGDLANPRPPGHGHGADLRSCEHRTE